MGTLGEDSNTPRLGWCEWGLVGFRNSSIFRGWVRLAPKSGRPESTCVPSLPNTQCGLRPVQETNGLQIPPVHVHVGRRVPSSFQQPSMDMVTPSHTQDGYVGILPMDQVSIKGSKVGPLKWVWL